MRNILIACKALIFFSQQPPQIGPGLLKKKKQQQKRERAMWMHVTHKDLFLESVLIEGARGEMCLSPGHRCHLKHIKTPAPIIFPHQWWPDVSGRAVLRHFSPPFYFQRGQPRHSKFCLPLPWEQLFCKSVDCWRKQTSGLTQRCHFSHSFSLFYWVIWKNIF